MHAGHKPSTLRIRRTHRHEKRIRTKSLFSSNVASWLQTQILKGSLYEYAYVPMKGGGGKRFDHIFNE